jgi:hypothetical protein
MLPLIRYSSMMILLTAAAFTLLIASSPQRLTAQSLESIGVSVGATRLPLASAWSGGLTSPTAAITMNVRAAKLWGAMLAGRVLGTTEGRSAAPVCAPDRGGCVEYKTPDALLNVAGGLYLLMSDMRLRATLSGGLLTAAGLRGAVSTSSPTMQAGLEFAPWPDRRVSPFLELHMLRTTKDIAGIRTLVMPGVGIAF